MKYLNERIKKLRKALDLTQQEFANRIGSKRTTIAKYETNTNIPSSAVISLICREFNVNESWLRTGEGEMFVPVAKDQSIFNFVEQVLQCPEDDFKRRFVSALPKLTEADWETLEKLSMLFTQSS